MTIRSRIVSGKPQKRLIHRLILFVLFIAILVVTGIAFALYRSVLKPNVIIPGGETSLLIPTGSTYKEVKTLLFSKGFIMNRNSFEWVAGRKNYPALIKPGHYILKNGMSNNELVNLLRSGAQTPVRVVFNNIRKKEELAGKIALQIEADSVSLIRCWNDRIFLKTLGTSPEKVFLLFIPDTYEFWWTTDAQEFTARMQTEFNKFWNEERKQKAKSIRMREEEVIILASIIEKETQKNDEKPAIAGVYVNRLRKGWPLQADPTVVYAWGDFEMKRVLKKHTEIDSPYNTYKYTGLPPGPICMPAVSSIDAVLNFRKHDYMFFCAKADMSGYHSFSRTLNEHNRHAKAYQAALNQRKIR